MNEPNKTPELRRSMGFVDLLLFVIITSFGTTAVAKAAEAGAIGVTFWVLGGLFFYLPWALCVIILSRRFPGEGGLYLWSQQTFGNFAGFMTGWLYWACILPFLPSVLYAVAGSALFAVDEQWLPLKDNPNYFMTVTIVCLLLVTAVNVIGLNLGKWLFNAGAVGTWVPALTLMVLGFIAWSADGPATDLSIEKFIPEFSLKNANLWPILLMYLTGLEAAAIMAGEIKDAKRWMPIALVLAAVLTIVTLILGTLSVVASIPAHELKGSFGFITAFKAAATRFEMLGLLPIAAVLLVVAFLGNVAAWSATGARLPFVAGVDRSIPAVFAKLHPRFQTPYVSLLFQAGIMAVLIVVGQAGQSTSGAFNLFLSMTSILTFITFLLIFAAAIKVQWSDPGPGRRRTPFGRWAVVLVLTIGLLTSAGSLVLAVIPDQDEKNKWLYVVKVVGLAVFVVGAGALIYGLGRRKSNAHREARIQE